MRAGVISFLLITPAFAIAQTDTSKKLKEVKVSTGRLPAVQTITPSQQVTSAEFYQFSALNVADAIMNFSGVVIKDYGGIGGLKTVSVRGLGANQLAVLYDGIQINDAQNGQVDLDKLNLINVQSISLFNGQPPQLCQPARSFAAASVLAVTAIHPHLNADKPFKVIAGINGGSFGLVNPYLQWQQRLSNTWSFVMNSYLEAANGRYKYKMNGDGSDTLSTRSNAGVHTVETDGGLYWAKSDSNKFSLQYNLYNSNRELPGAVIYYTAASKQTLVNEDAFIQSSYSKFWKSSLHLLLNGKLSDDYTRYRDPGFQNSTGGLDEQYKQREAYLSAALAYDITSKWEVSYAADAAISDLNINTSNFADPSRISFLNVFATAYTIRQWKVEGDLLNTNITETVKTGTASPRRNIFSPTVAASFKPVSTPGLQFRAFYKNIFRDPTFDELYYFAVDGARNIKPELANQLDAGLTYQKAFNAFIDYLTLTFDGYNNQVANKIVALPGPNPFVSSIVNLGKVSINGADLGIKAQTQLYNGWREYLYVNYSFQSAKNVTSPNDSFYDQQIPYTPKNTVAVNAGVSYKQLSLYFNQVLTSSRYYVNNNDPLYLVNGYSVSDISLIYKIAGLKVPAVVTAHVNNVFNESYVIVRSYPMPGRSYLLSLQITI